MSFYSTECACFSDTSKQRTKLRRKNTTERSNLDALIEKYNAVQSISVREPLTTSLNDVLNDNFPWVSQGMFLIKYAL